MESPSESLAGTAPPKRLEPELLRSMLMMMAMMGPMMIMMMMMALPITMMGVMTRIMAIVSLF